MIRSTSGPFGPYSAPQPLVDRVRSPVGGAPQLQNRDWYYLAFADAYPGGRIPVLAPMTFGSDGFPRVQLPTAHRARPSRIRAPIPSRGRRWVTSGSGTTTPTIRSGRRAASSGYRPRP